MIMARTLVQQRERHNRATEHPLVGEQHRCEQKSPPPAGRGPGGRSIRGSLPGRAQRGQAMIEYIIVLAFGVMLLIRPIPPASQDPMSPNPAGSSQSAVKMLADALRNYHKHYTYAMAIATIPDCDVKYSYAVDKVGSLDLSSLGITIDMNVDPCVDWTNPKLPIPSLSLSALGLPTDPATFVQNIVTNMVDDFIGDFSNPVGLLDDMLDFKPSDFF